MIRIKRDFPHTHNVLTAINTMNSIIPGKQFGRIIRPLIYLLLVGGLSQSLKAQSGTLSDTQLDVEVGDAFEYEELTQSTMEMDIMGEARTIEQEIASLQILEVKSISDDEINWKLSTASTVGGGAASSIGGYGGRNIPITTRFVTDREGQIKEIDLDGDETGLLSGDFMSIMNGSKKSLQGPGWAMPPDVRGRKVGERWVVPITDTTQGSLSGMMEMNFVVEVTTTYIYGGIVDTLGVQAVRLHWKYDSLRISGSMEVLKAGESGEITLNGSGMSTGVVWYSLQDRLKLAQVSEGKMFMNAEINMPDTMGEAQETKSFAMKMDLHTESSRQD